MDERCTVLVSSCDAYSDVWEPFFTILTRRWSLPYPVRLITEKKDFSFDSENFQTIKTGDCADSDTWSGRLICALKKIKTPFVLLLLEDFFMTAPVDQTGIERCIEYLEEDKDAVCFSFCPTTGNRPSKYDGFEKRPQDGLYRFNAQAGLWRTKELIGFLNPREDAWQWENEGNKRSFSLTGGFYSISPDAKPIFPYDYMKHGLIGGRWFKETKAFFEREGIDFDFNKRGFYDEKYKALLPSVATTFVMDEVLYVDRGRGFCEEDAVTSGGAAVKTGRFCFRYTVGSRAGELRWDPSSKSGFLIENLLVTINYTDKTSESFGIGRLLTNGASVDGKTVFLCDDAYFRFFTSRKKTVETAKISGNAVCPLTRAQIDAAYGRKSAGVGYYLSKLLR